MKIFALAFNFQERKEDFLSSGITHAQLNSEDRLLYFHKGDSILRPNMPFFLPDWTQQMEAGVEIVVQIKRVGKCIAERFAHRYYDKFTLALDFTARDLLNESISLGQAWTRAKLFDNALAVGEWQTCDEYDFPNTDLDFRLERNGELVQGANTQDLIHSIDQAIAEISQAHTLKIGDLILLGTPKDAPICQIGDRFEAFLGNKSCLRVEIR